MPIYWVESQLITYSTEKSFVRGDVIGDGAVDIGDALAILFRLFAGKAIGCQKSADTNDDGSVNVTDVVYLLNYLFLGGSAPKPPFGNCGLDPTQDGLPCDSFPGCP
jgi:hypothetical protein